MIITYSSRQTRFQVGAVGEAAYFGLVEQTSSILGKVRVGFAEFGRLDAIVAARRCRVHIERLGGQCAIQEDAMSYLAF